jgi:hypothetical protein
MAVLLEGAAGTQCGAQHSAAPCPAYPVERPVAAGNICSWFESANALEVSIKTGRYVSTLGPQML